MTPANSTVVVELTPRGRAAVAVAVVAGPEAVQAVGNGFISRGQLSLDSAPIGRILLGHWGQTSGEEVVVCRRDEERIEIHCHGGTAAIEAVVRRLIAEGCQRITWQDWIKRQSPEPIRAAAQIALANATTERAAAILLDQLNGALSDALHAIIAEIATANWCTAAESLNEILNRRETGLHLTDAWRVVLFGEPNVGKSSLINALAGFDRAIVSPTPGTTRDIVTLNTAIDGWPVQLADTAGVRDTHEEVESAGVELATMAAAAADIIILVHDAAQLTTVPVGPSSISMRAAAESPSRTIHVINKIDLIPTDARAAWLARLAGHRTKIMNPVLVSALTREGVRDLISKTGSMLAPAVPPPGSAVPFTIEQFNRLAAARAAIERHDAPAAIDLLQAMLPR
ncbi:MAG TPA: GTPase [Lacipirellulaceae bacterium]|nr:GTPase [Lacipirellulaceae bacterium]